MALTLDDVIGAPTDPDELKNHLLARGYIQPPAPPPAPEAVAKMTPPENTAPPSEVQPMRKPSNITSSTDWIGTENALHPSTPSMPPSAVGAIPSAPEIGGVPGGGAADTSSLVKPMTPLTAPTRAESNAAGKAEYQRMRPQITADYGKDPRTYLEQKLSQEAFDQQHHWGNDISAHPGTLGKIGHVLGAVGNIAGNALIPNVMASTPGTQLNRRLEMGQTADALNKEREAESVQGGRQAENEAREQQVSASKQTQAKQASEQQLVKDPTGNIVGWTSGDGVQHALGDADTPQAIKDEAAGVSEKPTFEHTPTGDIVQVTPGKNGAPATSNLVWKGQPNQKTETRQIVGPDGHSHDQVIDVTPGSPTFGKSLADLGRSKEDKQPSLTNELNKQKAGEALVMGFDKDGVMKLMPKAQADEEGLQHLAQATPKDRADGMQNTAALNDMSTKGRDVVNAAKALDQGAIQRGLIKEALEGGPDDWKTLASIKFMTPESKEYVQTVHLLRETALALPKQMTGGSRVSEPQAKALWNSVPGSGGDSKYAIAQMRKFDGALERLWHKVPQMEGQEQEHTFDQPEKKAGGGGGNQNQGAQNAAPPADGKSRVFDPQGKPHDVNTGALKDFLKDPQYKGWSETAPKH